MSSFKKAVKDGNVSNEQRYSGMKPWINGQRLVSSGNREWDEILGGGLALGTSTLLLEDSFSHYAYTLFAYSISESIHQGHKVLLICWDEEEADQILTNLPFNLSKGEVNPTTTSASTTTTASEEENAKKHLNIAWQYGKYIDNKTTTTTKKGSSYCSSYDLSSKILPELLTAARENIYTYCIQPSDQRSALHRLKTVPEMIQMVRKTVSGMAPVKVYFPRIETVIGFLTPEVVTEELPLIFLRSTIAIREEAALPSSSFFFLVKQDLIGETAANRVKNFADYAFSVDSFAGKADTIPDEYRYFCGFLHIHKLQHIGSIALSQMPSAKRFGLKRDKRKLYVEPLHLPPEESRAMKSSNTVSGSHTTSTSQASHPTKKHSEGFSCSASISDNKYDF